jgi:malic enzyme
MPSSQPPWDYQRNHRGNYGYYEEGSTGLSCGRTPWKNRSITHETVPHSERPEPGVHAGRGASRAWKSRRSRTTRFKYTAQKETWWPWSANGTAVLGLGDIGALAGKAGDGGKGGVVQDGSRTWTCLTLKSTARRIPDEVIKVCQLLEPTFGGINLEDIKAPECFYIEETLKKTMKIPVFHDDQHGTAIISGAALLNALEVVGKDRSIR